MIDINDVDIFEIYRNIFSLFEELSVKNSNISNVHSIDVVNTNDSKLNISMNYDRDYVIYISIDQDNIRIDAPSDKIRNYIKSNIVSEYPDYINLID